MRACCSPARGASASPLAEQTVGVIGALSIAAIESRLGEVRQREIGALLKREAAWIETRLAAGNAERPSKGKAR